MGKSCCENKASELKILQQKQGNVLKIVLVLNALMFVLEFAFGLISNSAALMADSLDMFGDAVVYAFSLYALDRGAVWRARAGLLKGLIMAVFAFFVVGQVIYKIMLNVTPHAETMGVIGVVALAVNAICLYLLYSHRSDDINMRSTWLCSRNDIIANVGVIGASAIVAWTNSLWPDVIVGTAIAALFLKSAFEVILEARTELKPGITEVAF